ncbi:MAG: OmpH family outer membrane protein [Spartobacteria bacterium]|nr:OmpH family outer membrane protein [Spartobacteria bacterium]
MKKIIILSTVIAALSVICSVQAMDQKIVFVDMEKVFNKYFKTELADAQLKEQAEEFNQERKDMVDRFEGMQEDFNTLREEAQNNALSEKAREEKRKSAEGMLMDLREEEAKVRKMEASRRKQLEDQQRRMRKRIVDEISETIETYAREQGYDVVLDSSGQTLNGVAVVLFTSGKYDVTDPIIEILNKGAK